METINSFAFEWWNHALLMYRTMLIKAESKRRRAIANTQLFHRTYSLRKSSTSLLSDEDQIGHCDNESHRINIGDVPNPTAETFCLKFNYDPAEMRRVFDLLDENKDGVICPEELQQFTKRLGFEFSEEKAKDMVRTVDKNSDDCVNFEEFLPLYSCLRGARDEDHATGDYANSHNCPTLGGKVYDSAEEETLLQAFFVFDENRDGLISALELQQVLVKLGMPEGRSLMSCQKMIERVDADGNGQVDFFEFKEMMCSDAFSLCKSY